MGVPEGKECVPFAAILAGSDRESREDEVSRIYSRRGAKDIGQELEFGIDMELSILGSDRDELLERGLETDVLNPIGRKNTTVTEMNYRTYWTSRYAVFLGVPRVRTHNQKITAAARAMAERKTVGDLS